MANNALIKWPSPAKLNLFLHINGRLANGYHQLQTLFQLLDFGDEMTFDVNTSGQIRLLTPIDGVKNTDNLVVKAAHALKSHGRAELGCDISLKKRLPMGGGIGGGSSNAATTLVALNYYWNLGLSSQALCEIGLSLGADVPVFVNGHSAFASGVGEQLLDVKIAAKHYLVLTPQSHVSTAEIFQHPELSRDTPIIDFERYAFDTTANDFQKIVTNSHPNIANALHRLLEYGPSRMTGTGACVFAVFDEKTQAVQAKQALAAGFDGFIARGVDVSPLNKLLNRLTNSPNKR